MNVSTKLTMPRIKPTVERLWLRSDSSTEQHLSAGHRTQNSYLEYRGQPVIFIFPNVAQLLESEARAENNRWKTPLY